MSYSTRLVSLNLSKSVGEGGEGGGGASFDSALFLLKFFLTKKHGLFVFKHVIAHFEIKIMEKPHTVLLPHR